MSTPPNLQGFLLEQFNTDHVDIATRGLRPPAGVGSPKQLSDEMTAKRRIWELHMHDDVGGEWECRRCTADVGWCMTLRWLSYPYISRPGYRDEWRP